MLDEVLQRLIEPSTWAGGGLATMAGERAVADLAAGRFMSAAAWGVAALAGVVAMALREKGGTR